MTTSDVSSRARPATGARARHARSRRAPDRASNARVRDASSPRPDLLAPWSRDGRRETDGTAVLLPADGGDTARLGVRALSRAPAPGSSWTPTSPSAPCTRLPLALSFVAARSDASSTVWVVPERFRRSRFLGAAGGALIAGAVAPRVALAGGRRSSVALALKAKNIGRRYAGDRALFATVSPGVPGRDTAAVSFALNRAATVKLEAIHTARRTTSVAWKTETRLPPGTALADLDARHRDAGGLLRDAADDRPQGIRHDGPRRQAPAVDRQAAGTRRPRARRRSRVPAPLVPARRADGAPDPRRRGCADPAVPPLWRGVHEQRAQRRDGRRAQG